MRKRLYIIVGIALLCASAWLLYTRVLTPDTGTLLYTSQGPVLSTEERTRIPEGFPIPYILGIDSSVTAGGTEALPESPVRYWVTVQSPLSPGAFILQYRTLFEKLGWTIGTSTVSAPNSAISATKDGRQLIVTALATDGGSTAHVVYTGQLWGVNSSPKP